MAYLDLRFVTRFFVCGDCCICVCEACDCWDGDCDNDRAPSSDLTLDGDDASSRSFVCITSSHIGSSEVSPTGAGEIGKFGSTGE